MWEKLRRVIDDFVSEYGFIVRGSAAMKLNGIDTDIIDIDFIARSEDSVFKPKTVGVNIVNRGSGWVSRRFEVSVGNGRKFPVDVVFSNRQLSIYNKYGLIDGDVVTNRGVLVEKVVKIANYCIVKPDKFNLRFYVPKQVVDVVSLLVNGVDFKDVFRIVDELDDVRIVRRFSEIYCCDAVHYGIYMAAYRLGLVSPSVAYGYFDKLVSEALSYFKK